LIGVQDEDSCGRSGQCETPQACRGGIRVTRGKRSLARKSKAVLEGQNNFFWSFSKKNNNLHFWINLNKQGLIFENMLAVFFHNEYIKHK
jgi:methionyl-tRNA synthetase